MRSHLNLTAVQSWLLNAAGRAAVLLVVLAAVLAVAHLPTPSATPTPQAPTTAAYGTALDDAQSEGRDVLPLSFHDAPPSLWNALPAGTYDDDVPGIGTAYVPVGTVVDVPGGLWLATLDGWGHCSDWQFDVECSATGPVEMTDIPVRTATQVYRDDPAALPQDRAVAALGTMTVGATDAAPQVVTVAYSAPTAALSPRCVQAARDILRASQRGVRIEEDLSYRGMPARVAACNDVLATAYFADGHQFHGHHGPRLRAWLRQVIRTGQVHTPAGTTPVV